MKKKVKKPSKKRTKQSPEEVLKVVFEASPDSRERLAKALLLLINLGREQK